MTLRKLVAAVALFGSTLGLTGCGAADAGGGEGDGANAEIVVGRFVGPFVFQVGMSTGAFDDLNLKATDIDSGPAALPLIQRGSLSGADGLSEPPLVTAFERDLDLKIVWSTNLSSHALLTKPEIKGPEDMRGKKFAAPGGSILQVELAQYLAEHDMSMDDIEFVDLDAASIVSSYKTNQIDGAFLWQPQASSVEDLGARKLATSQGTSFDVFSAKYIEENPEAVQAYVCAIAKVQQDFVDDPEPAWQVLADELDMDGETVRKLLPKENVFPPDEIVEKVLGEGGLVYDKMVHIGDTMADLDQVEKSPKAADVKKMVDTRFAKAAEAGECSE